jgi:hypothetical protein
VETDPSPEQLREMIDDALEEIERTELEMLDLLSDLIGPDNAKRVADQISSQSEAERFKRLVPGRDLESANRPHDGRVTPEHDEERSDVDRPSC